MQKAIEVTEDEIMRNRIRREGIPLKFVLLSEYPRFKEYEKQNGSSPVILPAPEEGLTEFMALLEEFDVKMYHEDWSDNPDHTIAIEQLLKSKLFPERK